MAEGALCTQGKEREGEGDGLGQEGFRSQHRGEEEEKVLHLPSSS